MVQSLIHALLNCVIMTNNIVVMCESIPADISCSVFVICGHHVKNLSLDPKVYTDLSWLLVFKNSLGGSRGQAKSDSMT